MYLQCVHCRRFVPYGERVRPKCSYCGKKLPKGLTALSGADCARDRRCVICDRTLSARQTQKTCDNARCRDEYNRQCAREAFEKELQGYRREALRIRKQMADRQGAPVPSSVPLAILPSNDLPLATLPEERKEALREHLRALVAEALADPERSCETEPQRTPRHEDEAAFLRGACALCRGRCCQDGGNNAFLTADTMREYFEQHPGRDVEEVVEDYLCYVPQISYEGSCIYHAESGCTLPREMRSEVSRNFYCIDLREFRISFDGTEDCAFGVATESGEVMRAAVIDRDGLLPWEGEANEQASA